MTVFLSCKKKFDHFVESGSPEPLTSCELCQYADSLEGTYRGYFTGIHYYTSPDTINIDLEHIFLNLGTVEDSTKMFFKITLHFSNGVNHTQYSYIDNNQGEFYDYPNGDHMSIVADSLHLRDHNPENNVDVEQFRFDGKKIP